MTKNCLQCNSEYKTKPSHAGRRKLRFLLDNGRTLCRECHKQTETFGVRTYKPTLQFN